MPFAPGKLANRVLTGELKKLASEVHTIADDGTQITREEALAAMIWRQALGWKEVTRTDEGNRKEVIHPPVAWCQQFLFERMEGKAPIATVDETGGIKAADKVRELAKARINSLAVAKVGPPKHKPKGD